MGKKSSLAKVANAVTTAITDPKVQKALFGTYSDGSTRSLVDAWNDEILSPKDKSKKLYKKKKSGKKKVKL